MHFVKQSCVGAGVAPDDEEEVDEDDVVVVVAPPVAPPDEDDDDVDEPVCEELDCFVFDEDDGLSSTSSSSSSWMSLSSEPSREGTGGAEHPVPVNITAAVPTTNVAVASSEYSERFDSSMSSWSSFLSLGQEQPTAVARPTRSLCSKTYDLGPLANLWAPCPTESE
jgi:hypothetical protein